MKETY